MKVNELMSGGAPLLGEPLPIELVNVTYAIRGHLQDGLQTVEHLAAWLRDNRDRFAVRLTDQSLLAADTSDLTAARELRHALRLLAEAAVEGRHPEAGVIETINQQVRAAPRWRELSWGDGPQSGVRSAARPVTAALAEVAEAAVELFSGPTLPTLRACQAPGCVLYFLRNHPRREWCSPGCGNRARAARHYELVRKRSDRGTEAGSEGPDQP